MITVAAQVAAFERQAMAFVRRVLTGAGRTFRARMNAERIGGGAGSALRVKSGKLKRSFQYHLVETPGGFRMDASIGTGGAEYAQDHEEFGRLEFENTFQEEADRALEEIRIGVDALGRLGPGSGVSNVAAAPVSAGIREIGQHILQKRATASAAARARRAANLKSGISGWRSIRKGS
jgi:hypothetical protein